MLKIIKRLPKGAVTIAVAFLLVQVFCSLYLPTLTAGIVNNGVIKGNVGYIWHQGLIMVSFAVMSLVAALVNTYVAAKIAYGLGSGLRFDIFRKTTCFANDEFDKIGPASLITRNTNDVTQVQTLIEMGLKFFIMAPLYLFGGIILSWRLSPKLSLAFICAAPFITLACVLVFRNANPLFLKLQTKLDELNLIFREGLTGIKIIRAFNRGEWEYKRYLHANADYAQKAIRVNVLMGFLMPVTSIFMSMAAIAITWMGALGVSLGNMEIGTIIGVITYSTQIQIGFLVLANIINLIPRGQTSAKRIYEVLDMETAIRDPETPRHLDTACARLAFNDVSFRYQDAEECALENVSFAVERGQTLAIIGSTGSGKSTLLNLLMRFYDASRGHIEICGTDIRNVPQHELRAAVSLAPQQSFLFQGTVRDNIKMGDPEASDDAVWQALGLADADGFVRELEGGLDGIVEKGGGNFSGGQKQRLGIARALIKKAPVYAFDDSFSALDFKTDARIRAAIKPALKDAITLIVAQRISTVMHANMIVVLDDGKVAGLGTHDELAATNRVYREILQSQFERGTDHER